MGILQLISTSNFITVNKDLIKELGLEEAIMLGELASEYDYWNNKNEIEDGYFYSTIENIEEKTTLTAYKQRKCLENLKNKGIIDIQIRGIPAKRYIKINKEKVIEIFNNKLLKNLTTGCKKTSQLEVKKLNGNNNIINNNIKKNNINKNIKKEKIKKSYGEYENVKFTDEEFEKVKAYFPKDYMRRIQSLDDYIQQTGKKYKDFVATLKNWARKEGYKPPLLDQKQNEELKEIDTSQLTPEEYDLLVKKKITIQDLIEKGRINV